MDPDLRLFVLTYKKKTHVYSEAAMALFAAESAPLSDAERLSVTPEEAEAAEKARAVARQQYDQLLAAGDWKEFWFLEAEASHEEAIRARCLVKNDLAGFRYDATLEAAARCEVLVEKWNGIPEKPSMDAYRRLKLPLAKALDEALLAHMYPQGIDPSFFTASSAA